MIIFYLKLPTTCFLSCDSKLKRKQERNSGINVSLSLYAESLWSLKRWISDKSWIWGSLLLVDYRIYPGHIFDALKCIYWRSQKQLKDMLLERVSEWPWGVACKSNEWKKQKEGKLHSESGVYICSLRALNHNTSSCQCTLDEKFISMYYQTYPMNLFSGSSQLQFTWHLLTAPRM